MTVNAETAKSGPYSGNGSTTVFAYAFKALDQAHLVVTSTVTATGVETVQELTTHYTVSGVGDDGGGNVTMGSAPAVGVTLTITRAVPQTQTTDLVNRGAVQPVALETAVDRGVQMVQDFQEEMTRVLTLPVSTNTSTISATLPAPVGDSYIKWNVGGTALENTAAVAGQILGTSGSAAAPYYSFSGDPNSGLYRIGADNIGLTLGGTKRVDFAAAGTSITGTLTTSGILSVDATTTSTSGTTGSIHTDGGIGVAGTAHIVGVTTHGGDVLSDTDSTDSIGSTGVRWLKLWVDSIQTTANTDVAGDLTVTGNLTVNGTTVTNDAVNTEIKDPLIELNSGAGSNANDLGLIMERGSTGNNAVILWDESGDFFTVGTTTATADSTGNMSYAFAPFKCSALTATSGTLAGLTSIAMSAGATLTAGFLDEDDMASDSAVAGVTQQAAKAYVDSSSKAAGISMTWETATTDTDQGVGKVWANNATLSSATVLYFDDVERNSVSINALIDSLDDPTATNSATIYIQEAGSATAGVVFHCSGSVSSASTYSKVTVSHVATFGTLADGDVVGVTIAFSGNNGGGGDLESSNNLSDVDSASTSLTNIGGVGLGLVLALG